MTFIHQKTLKSPLFIFYEIWHDVKILIYKYQYLLAKISHYDSICLLLEMWEILAWNMIKNCFVKKTALCNKIKCWWKNVFNILFYVDTMKLGRNSLKDSHILPKNAFWRHFKTLISFAAIWVFWDMATLPLPRTSSQKWQKV